MALRIEPSGLCVPACAAPGSFLQPRTRLATRASRIMLFILPPLVITQHQHQDYVNLRQKSQRVTERPMDDVPYMQHAVRFRQEEDLFRKKRLFTRHGDGPLQNS